MKVFVTGASGFIGTEITKELLSAGHQVLGLARSDESTQKLHDLGAEVIKGSLTDLESLKSGAAATDGTIHAAFSNDFNNVEQGIKEERKAVEAMGEVLKGTNKPFIAVGGTPAIPGKLAVETDAMPVEGIVGGRVLTGDYVLSLKNDNVRSMVIGLPRSVYSAKEQRFGFTSYIINAAKQNEIVSYVNDGSQRWPAVHVLDAANLFKIALEKGEPGVRYHAVGDEGIPMKRVSEVIAIKLDLSTQPVLPEFYGPLGPIFSIDQPASSKITQEKLGWKSMQPGLISEIESNQI